MKKVVVSLAFGLFLTGMAAVPTSAEEYQVVRGDSLWEIAQEYETTVTDLQEKNELTSDLIYPEQILQIDKEENYIVEKGDTLSEIGVEHEVSVKELKDWNSLTTDLIIIGQELIIKTSNTQSTEVKAASTSTPSTKERSEPVSSAPSASESQRTLTMVATAYTAECTGCSGITATGINLNEDRDKKVIAVDPDVIPLGTKVHVEGYGQAIAGDTGGAIKGNRIDIHVPTKDIAYEWGVREVEVKILD
ncbi:LysM peptidoglycan-binding and 3D domain-containing protein [Aquibacillus kalidii]|uniref:LysM peptidoglycan-binding and 3D domain-containing protein n=1 Tax=Aquibacillus kalidii TaxID=2762597 RepID=UPI0016459537|nr:3D domain-containing protein [Aquibacillus kalidii]